MAKKEDPQDIIYDIDVDLNDPENQVIIKDNKGIMREANTGRLVKGTANLATAKKAYNLDKILQDKLGKNVERALQKLAEIALYDPDMPMLVYDKETGKSQMQNRKYHFYNAQTQMQALTLLCKYFYGNPRKEIQIDQNIDVKIEKKVADLTKLINENSERLKVINGGKDD